jgi:hypothetical protein
MKSTTDPFISLPSISTHYSIFLRLRIFLNGIILRKLKIKENIVFIKIKIRLGGY